MGYRVLQIASCEENIAQLVPPRLSQVRAAPVESTVVARTTTVVVVVVVATTKTKKLRQRGMWMGMLMSTNYWMLV
jgi:hypothetical protein